MKITTLAVAAAIVLMLAAPSMAGTVLYGTVGAGSPATLVTIDPATGALTTVGPVGYALSGLEFEATSGRLFGMTTAHDSRAYSTLIEIDTTTGAGTVIGYSGSGNGVPGLTSDSAGGLFSWLQTFPGRLATVDPTNGAASVVGSPTYWFQNLGLAFDAADALWLVGQSGGIHAVDPATGAATFQRSLGSTAHHGDFNPDDGMYYGIQGRFGSQQLIRADLTAGTFTVIARTPNLHTLSFTGTPGNAVPLPAAAWMGLGLLGLLGAVRRQRRLRRLSRLP